MSLVAVGLLFSIAMLLIVLIDYANVIKKLLMLSARTQIRMFEACATQQQKDDLRDFLKELR